MKMTDVKVGMKLRSTVKTGFPEEVIVTKLTPEGFEYTHEPYSMKVGLNNGVPEFGICKGGTHYGYEGEAYYEEVR